MAVRSGLKRVMTKPLPEMTKVQGHAWGIVDTLKEHAINVAKYSKGTIQHEGQDIQSLAEELLEFLELPQVKQRALVARNLRFYNRYTYKKKVKKIHPK